MGGNLEASITEFHLGITCFYWLKPGSKGVFTVFNRDFCNKILKNSGRITPGKNPLQGFKEIVAARLVCCYPGLYVRVNFKEIKDRFN